MCVGVVRAFPGSWHTSMSRSSSMQVRSMLMKLSCNLMFHDAILWCVVCLGFSVYTGGVGGRVPGVSGMVGACGWVGVALSEVGACLVWGLGGCFLYCLCVVL